MNDLGVKYAGTFSDHSGYGQANRSFITALHIAGVDVSTELVIQVPERSTFGWIGELANHLKDRQISYKVKFIHLTPDMYHKYREANKYNIGHLFWETDRLPEGWAEACNTMNEIWTASESQAKMIKESGVTVPIHWFPQPIDVSLVDAGLSPYIIPNFVNSSEKKFVFYSIYQWIERKNPKDLITTFWKTFENNKDVALVVKTYGVNYSEGQFNFISDRIREWKTELGLKHYPKVFVSRKLLSTREVFRLHMTGDCYVCTSRGEGWCIPTAEAMLMGKPVIGINKTGIFDSLDKKMYLSCDTTESEVTSTPGIKYYKAPQKWLNVSTADLSKQMLWIYNNRKEASELGKKGKQFVEENFNYWTVGNAMKSRLESIYSFL